MRESRNEMQIKSATARVQRMHRVSDAKFIFQFFVSYRIRRTWKRSENCSTLRMTHRWALDGFSNQTMYTTFIPLLSFILTFASDSLCGSSTSGCYSNLRERVCMRVSHIIYFVPRLCI